MAFTQSKGPMSSLTIVSSVVAVFVSVLSAFGVEIAPGVVPQLNEIMTGLAASVAIYGRIRAKTLIE